MIIKWPQRQAGGTTTLDEADVREGVHFGDGLVGTLTLIRESVTVTVTEDEVVTVNVGES